jgi:cytochrome P450
MFGLEYLVGPITTTLLIGASTVILLYWYSTRNHNYWKKKGVPFVEPYPLFGNTIDVMRNPVHEVEHKRYKKYGKIYGHFESNNPLLSVAEPALIREVLVKDFPSFPNRRVFNTGDPIIDNMLSLVRGDDWKRIRTIVTPTFTTGKIKRMLSILKDCSKTLVQNMKNDAKAGKNFNAKRLYGAFTMDVIASSAFSTKIDSHNDPDNQFVKYAKDVFNQPITWKAIVFQLAPSVARFFRLSIFNSASTVFFKEATMQIIEERKRTGQTRNDFLQLLLDTAKELADDKKLDLPSEKEEKDIAANYGEDTSGQQVFKNTSKYMSVDELVAQCVIFFLAGYDTTASTLSFASYFLAMNPGIQERLAQEVDEAIKETKGELTYEAIQNMKYLDNVISETLRICSPVIRLERSADADYELGDTGIIVEKGTVVTIPTFALHRDPQLYPDPEKFDPDRFTPEERSKRDQFAYLPFGAGPRNCVAMRFALMEVKVCLAHVIANFNFKRSPETKVPLEFNMGNQGLLQPKEILLSLEVRKNSALLQ